MYEVGRFTIREHANRTRSNVTEERVNDRNVFTDETATVYRRNNTGRTKKPMENPRRIHATSAALPPRKRTRALMYDNIGVQ